MVGNDWWLVTICNTEYVEFSLVFLGWAKQDCVTKTGEIFSFLTLINNLVAIGLGFLLLSISTIISSKTINALPFLSGLYFQHFYKDHPYHLSIQ